MGEGGRLIVACDCVGKFLFDYQTLLTGIGAIVAALFAISATRDQIKQVDDHRQRDRAGKLRAARATFPLTLSSICEYATTVANVLQSAKTRPANPYDEKLPHLVVDPPQVELPEFPKELLESLERNIEFAENAEVSDRIASIMREVQILQAKALLLNGPTITGNAYISRLIVQAASTYARAESLFLYARLKSETVISDPLWGRTFEALRIMGIRDAEVTSMAKAQQAKGEAPGEADSEEPT